MSNTKYVSWYLKGQSYIKSSKYQELAEKTFPGDLLLSMSLWSSYWSGWKLYRLLGFFVFPPFNAEFPGHLGVNNEYPEIIMY